MTLFPYTTLFRSRGFVSYMKVTYAEQLDCKERVDKLTKTLNGDE